MTAIDTTISHPGSSFQLVSRSTRQRLVAVGIAAATAIAIGGAVARAGDDTATCRTWHPQGTVTGRYQQTLHPQQALGAQSQHTWSPVVATNGQQHTWSPQVEASGQQHTWNPDRKITGAILHSWNPASAQANACSLPI